MYWPEYIEKSITDFISLLDSTGKDYEYIIINNNNKYNSNYLTGSNVNQEFSAWDEAINKLKYHDNDILVFANDTFSTKNSWSEIIESKYSKAIISLFNGEYDVFGEVHKYFTDMRVNGQSTNKWIRTHLFGITVKSYMRIGGCLSLSEEYLDNSVYIDDKNKILWSNDINKGLQLKIEKWIFPKKNSIGWYRSHSCDSLCNTRKIKTILNEKWISACIFNKGLRVNDCSNWSTYSVIEKILSFIMKYEKNK